MRIPKVENMDSPRSGRPVANQFIITTDEGEFFQSYSTIIAFNPVYKPAMKERKIVLDKGSWNYSVTTLKYLKRFLGSSYSKKEIEQRIKDGTYKLADLN